LYSKNDSIDRVKKYDLDIDKAITKMTQRSAAISIGMVAIINFMTFIYLGATKDTVVQSLMNTAMLVFSGVMGVDAGRKIVLQYVNIAGEKLEFLKSFLIRAEHYAKPTDDDLEQKRIREDKEEEIRFNKEQEKEQREYTREIEREQRKLTHEAKMAEIKTQGEVARAKILEANKPQEQQTIKLEVVNKEAK
jgi:cell shape-determining protein MreC